MSTLKPLILLVEDDPVSQKVLQKIVGSFYDVRLATDGAEALRILHNEKPALILTDILMPHIDGFGLLSQVKKDVDLRDIPVIVITVKTDDEHIRKAFELGAVDYVKKPFSAVELKVRLSAHLKIDELRRKLLEQNLALEWTIRDLKDIGYALSEDLKIPLDSLLTVLGGCVDSDEFAYNELKIENAFEAAQRLKKMIGNLSRYLSVAGQDQFIDIVDLNDIVGEVLKNLEDKIVSVGGKIDIEILPRVEGMRSQLLHVFQHLIRNAIENAHPDRVLYLNIYVEDIPEGKAVVIRDNGAGISEEIQNKFNECGQRFLLEQGVGLNLCKRILARHGAVIGIRRDDGHGTVVWIRFERYL